MKSVGRSTQKCAKDFIFRRTRMKVSSQNGGEIIIVIARSTRDRIAVLIDEMVDIGMQISSVRKLVCITMALVLLRTDHETSLAIPSRQFGRADDKNPGILAILLRLSGARLCRLRPSTRARQDVNVCAVLWPSPART